MTEQVSRAKNRAEIAAPKMTTDQLEAHIFGSSNIMLRGEKPAEMMAKLEVYTKEFDSRFFSN